MKQYVTIDMRGFTQILDTLEKLNSGGTQMLIKASARICAVQLALHTQPFSVGQKGAGKGYQYGISRVEYDVKKAIRSNSKLTEIADHMTNDKIQKRLMTLIEAGKYDEVVKILIATRVSLGFGSETNLLKTMGAIKEAHGKSRNKKTGRVYKKMHKLYVAPQELVSRYVADMQKRVGKSKAGWADCARKINATKGDGAREIAAWAKNKTHGLHGRIHDATGGIEGYRYVEMHNMIPWVSRLISAGDIQASEQFAKANLIKSMKRAFAAAAKKHPDILGFIEDEINSNIEGE